MRLSLLASACTSAVLSMMLTLPLPAQTASQPLQLTIVRSGKKSLHLHCKDGKDLKQCIAGLQGLSPKELKRLKTMGPKLQRELDQSLGKTKDRSGVCYALRVYEFPKGFPETDDHARPKVTDCTSAALVKVKPIQLKKPRLKGQ